MEREQTIAMLNEMLAVDHELLKQGDLMPEEINAILDRMLTCEFCIKELTKGNHDILRWFKNRIKRIFAGVKL